MQSIKDPHMNITINTLVNWQKNLVNARMIDADTSQGLEKMASIEPV